jgi:hypothetical protein
MRKTPDEEELDGVRLDYMTPGSIWEVSASLGSWLIVEGYAVPEMRHDMQPHEEDFLMPRDTLMPRETAADGGFKRTPHRRRNERR